MSKYCGECGCLSVNERLQSNKHERHECKQFNLPVFHLNEHPLLPRLPECLAKGKDLVQHQRD